MTTYVPLDLSSKSYQITVTETDDVTFAFVFTAIDTTGYTFSFPIYKPDGTIITTLVNGSGITNTPVIGGGNSIVTISFAGSVTTGYASQSLTSKFKRTDTSSVRTYATGPIIVK